MRDLVKPHKEGRLPVILSAEAAECGLACIAMVGNYYGHRVGLNALRPRFGTSLSGASVKNLMAIADSLDLSTRALRVELSAIPKLKLPAVLHWNFSHFVVLKSVRGDKVVIHDPALKDNITLMTIGEAQSFEWDSLFSKLKGGTVADVRFELREISVRFSVPPDDPSSLRIKPHDVVKAQGLEIPLAGLAIEAARRAGLTRKIMSNLGEVMKRTDHFSFTFSIQEDAHIVLDGKSFKIADVTATMSIHPRYESVEWRPIDFNGKTVATGTFPADFLFPGEAGNTVVTASKEAERSMNISLLGPSDADVALDVFPHALWQENADNSPDD